MWQKMEFWVSFMKEIPAILDGQYGCDKEATNYFESQRVAGMVFWLSKWKKNKMEPTKSQTTHYPKL